MEKDLKVLEQLIEEYKKLGDTSEETRISQPLFKIIIKALENLIEGYKEQQKEIKQLKEDISNMYDEKIVRNILEDECGLSKYEIDEILN